MRTNRFGQLPPFVVRRGTRSKAARLPLRTLHPWRQIEANYLDTPLPTIQGLQLTRTSEWTSEYRYVRTRCHPIRNIEHVHSPATRMRDKAFETVSAVGSLSLPHGRCSELIQV